MKLFEFDIHIGDWRVLIQDRDIQNGAVKSRHIADGAVTTIKIGDGEVKSRHIATDAVTTDKIGDKEVKSKNISPGAVTNEKLAEECITGDEIEGNTVKNGKLANNAVHTRNIKDRNVTSSKIAKNSILTEHIKPKAVTPEKTSDDFISKIVTPSFNTLDDKYKGITDELYSMIRSLVVGGLALSDRMGSREDIGITQKAITDAINALNARIDDIAGEYTQGFAMIVSPDTFISEDTCQVNISATASVGKFDHIAFYVDDELIVEGDLVATLAHTTTISDTAEIKCVATILGVQYTKRKTVTKYYPFFIGGGETVSDILIPENARNYSGNLAGAYDVVCHEGDHIIVMIPLSLVEQVVRLDMNGFEIPCRVQTDGRNLVYISLNTYQEGTWNIDITNNTADLSLADVEQIDSLYPQQNT